MNIPHSLNLPVLQYLSHTSWTKDLSLGSSVFRWNIRCVMVMTRSCILEQFPFVQSTVNCLVNYAFYHQETKYCSCKHCAKIYISESSVPNARLALGPHCCRRQMSLDHYIIDVSVKQIRVPKDNSFFSDWMHLRGLGPI